MAFVLRDAQGREQPVSGQLQIGRDPTNQIPIDDPLASRVHATIWEDRGKLFIRDEQSSNGTIVNGKRIQETRLRPRDQIQIGNSVFQVAAVSGAAAAATPSGSGEKTSFPGEGGQPSAPAAAKPKGRGCARWLIAGCLVLLLAGCATGAGGYLAYKSGALTVESVLGFVGLGPAEIEVDNFREDPVSVSITQLDAPSESLPLEMSIDLNPFDVRTVRVQNPGVYQVGFSTSGGATDLGMCTLELSSGEGYQFVTLPEMVVINRVGDPVSVGTDLIVSTSTLCR